MVKQSERSIFRVHLIGRSGSGKTHFGVQLVAALKARGHRVGTIKHSGHAHELDTPGKDSHRLRQAGGDPAAVISEGLAAVFIPGEPGRDLHQQVLMHFQQCDLIVAEGRHHAPEERPGRRVLWLEVHRADCGKPPLAAEIADVHAVVGDGELPAGMKRWPLDASWVAKAIEEQLAAAEQ